MPLERSPVTRHQKKLAEMQNVHSGEEDKDLASAYECQEARILELQRIVAEMSEQLDALATKRTNDGEDGASLETNAKIRDHNMPINEGTATAGYEAAWRLPRGGWLQNPFQELSFVGRSDRENPMRFLEGFERIAAYEGVEKKDRLYYFAKCMKDQASTWYELHRFDTIGDAKAAFKDRYWGEEAQAKFRERLYMEKYNGEKQGSMADYTMSLARDAKFLEPPMSEREIIRCLKRHFDRDIAREIRPSTVKTVAELVEMLEEMDNSREPVTERKPRHNETGSKTEDIKRRGFPIYNRSNEACESRQLAIEPRYTKKMIDQNHEKHEAREKQRTGNRPIVRFPSNEGEEEKGKEDKRRENMSGHLGKGETKAKTGLKNRPRMAVVETKSNDSESPLSSEEETQAKRVSIVRTRDLLEDIDQAMEEGQYVRTKEEPVLEVRLDNITVRALVDTGAQVSAITKELFDELKSNNVPLSVIPVKRMILKGVFMEKGMSVAHKVQLDVEILEANVTFEFVVVNKLVFPMVLGLDFLRENRAHIKCEGSGFEIVLNPDVTRNGKINAISLQEARVKLDRILEDNRVLFNEEVGCVTHYEHEIKVTSKAGYKSRTYPIPDVHKEAVRNHLKELEQVGIIEKATTPYINPLVVVTKRTGDIRVCLDAREINKRVSNDLIMPSRQLLMRYFAVLEIRNIFQR